MNGKMKNTKIYGMLWFFSAWLISLEFLMKKKKILWKLVWLDTDTTIECVKLAMLLLVIGVFIAAIVYLFVQNIIKVSISIRFGKKRLRIEHRNFINKHIRIICCIHILLAICFSSVFNIPEFFRSKNEWKGDIIIAHGGGGIDKLSYTNAPEAIHENYKKGHRTFEIDMVLTSDNKVACIHDWDVPFQEGRKLGIAPSSEEFLKYPIRGAYTPILFEDLCKIMNEYPDMWLITDSKHPDGNEIRIEFNEMVSVAKELGMEHILDRVIVQIYNESMYDIVMDIYPFHSWIFTLYQRWGGDLQDFEEIAKFCTQKDIQNLTINKGNINDEVMKIAEKYQLDVYTHTVNELDEAKEFLEFGVKGIYTDYISPSDLKK